MYGKFKKSMVFAGYSAAGLICVLPASAFPPAPYHTLYGMVRGEHGQVLRVDGARVVFYRNGSEFLSSAISESTSLDQNYQIRLRMDMQRAGTETYTALANATGTPFTLGVVLHDVVHYPIEMSAPHGVGQPGERVRLDLTLGIDGDGDGIPDAWEHAQLYAGGHSPGDDGWSLSLIDRDGDFDGDGISNWNEYIAGTYATDPTDYLALRLTEKFPQSVRLGFYAIHGKTYSLETSEDLLSWKAAPLYLTNPADPGTGDGEEAYPGDDFDDDDPPAANTGLRSESSGLTRIYAVADPATDTYYRLRVR